MDWEKKYYKAKLDPETKKYLRHNREGYIIVKIRAREREREREIMVLNLFVALAKAKEVELA